MKKTRKIFWTLAMAGFIAGTVFSVSSCKNNDDDESPKTEQEKTEIPTTTNEIADDVKDEAFSIIRELCDLSAYNSANSVEDVDSDGKIIGGIEELPDNWQNSTFTPDFGFQLDEEHPTVWSYPIGSTEEVAEWFIDLVGLAVDGETFPTDFEWEGDGFGVLKYTAISGDPNLYATVDVNVSVIPGLTQIRFVPSSVIEAAKSVNSYKWEPYFSAGDVILRKKDSTYWMCVRPAGGPMKKDKSYWMCLNTDGTNVITPESKSYTLKYNTDNDAPVTKQVDWIYAKELMSIKTAKAAFHTLNMLTMTEKYQNYKFYNTAAMVEQLKNNGSGKNFDVSGLNKWAGEICREGLRYSRKKIVDESHFEKSSFLIAYGKPKKDKTRATKIRGDNYFTQNAAVSYIQPFIDCYSKIKNWDAGIVEEVIATYQKGIYIRSASKTACVPYSVTDTFDEGFIRSFKENSVKNGAPSLWGEDFCYPLDKNRDLAVEDTDSYKWNEALWYYDFKNFLHSVTDTGVSYKHPYKTYALWSPNFTDREDGLCHVIYSPELIIKDNKGTSAGPRNPLKEADYEVIVRYDGDKTENGFDWWKSLDNTVREVDGKEVKWSSENK